LENRIAAMLTVREVWDLIDREVGPLAPQPLPLVDAVGCRLGEDVLADADMPAFSRSSIDGFAVRAGSGPGRYRLTGEVRPGRPEGDVPEEGAAIRIFTGSAIADGLELVMVEDAEVEGGEVVFRKAPEAGLIRRRASQARAGEVLLAKGTAVTPGAVALLATVGKARPLVTPRPSVAHLSTGSELVGVEEHPSPGFIRDSNSPLLEALSSEAGAQRIFHGRASENIDEAVALLEGQAADVLLVSGGASVGAYDGTAEILRRLGFAIHSSKVRSRPGKPLIFATRDGRAAFGLPGNPLSHFVCFHLFVRRALDRLAGCPPRTLVSVHADGTPEPDPRETWWPARVRAEDGLLRARPLPWTDSSDLTGLPSSNALLRVGTEKTNALAEALVFGSLDS
jgi:molybdopterin molybdotransferase